MSNDSAGEGPVERGVRPLGYLHGEDFIPHGPNGWTGGVPVYDQAALDAAVAAERRRFVAMLEYAMELDGFGCACEPDRKCGTCQARDTVKKALGPLLRTLKA